MHEVPFAEFLFTYLRERGVRRCFGIPGDYILPLYKTLEGLEGIDAVVATHEPCAAFSADAYARQTGLGVLLATYGVGALNALNGVAGAYAEMSPLVVVSGGPPRGYAHTGDLFAPLRHHVVRDPSDQLAVFSRVTDLALRVESPEGAAAAVRRVVRHAQRTCLPVYLEIPTDMLTAPIPVPPPAAEEPPPPAVAEALQHAVALFAQRIAAASSPVLLVGEEVGRFRLQAALRRISAARHAPAALTILGKGVLAEGRGDGVLGVYAGVMTPDPEVRRIVERADLVVLLGSKITDVNCGAFTADLRRDRLLVAKSGWVGDGYLRHATEIPFAPFVEALAGALEPRGGAPAWPSVKVPDLLASDSLMDRYLAVIEAALTEDDVVVADTGDACYGSQFFRVRRDDGYLAPTFYNTMGFAVPAALGAQLAVPGSRAVVLVGDGAFQMTGLELANMVRHGLDAIVVLFNNGGFGMQRIFADGAFNDHGVWDYGRVVELVGGGRAWRAESPEALGEALVAARAHRDGPSLIEAVLPRGVISSGLRVMGQALAREKTGSCPLAAPDADACEHEARCAFCRAAIWR